MIKQFSKMVFSALLSSFIATTASATLVFDLGRTGNDGSIPQDQWVSATTTIKDVDVLAATHTLIFDSENTNGSINPFSLGPVGTPGDTTGSIGGNLAGDISLTFKALDTLGSPTNLEVNNNGIGAEGGSGVGYTHAQESVTITFDLSSLTGSDSFVLEEMTILLNNQSDNVNVVAADVSFDLDGTTLFPTAPSGAGNKVFDFSDQVITDGQVLTITNNLDLARLDRIRPINMSFGAVVVAVPEPSPLGLLCLGGLAMVAVGRNRD